MSFPQWLRSNSEHYLLQDAQARVARREGLPQPRKPRTPKDHFWRRIFVPVYRVLPASVRRFAIQALPGSHRMDWPEPDHKPHKPAV